MLCNPNDDVFNDPHTNTQNPSVAKIPDVTHIINRTFGFVDFSCDIWLFKTDSDLICF